MTDLKPTQEQQAVIDAAKGGGNLVIQAGAGTGKTSTLELISTAMPKSSLYVAYNKAIATDAASRFPRFVTCKTSHSLAFAAVGRRFAHRLNSGRKPSWQTAEDMGLRWATLGRDIRMTPARQAMIAADTVRRFCYSADDEIGAVHVPYQNGITGRDHQQLVRLILPLAKTWWDDVQSPSGIMPFEHDHYLKIWAMSRPDLGQELIFLDEAQDTNPVLAKVILDQDAQQIVVGDGCQQMYAWRGAVDSLKDWPNATHLYLQQSWRFGQAIADEANKWLSLLPTPMELIGNPGMDSVLVEELEVPRAVLCRTNAGAVGAVMTHLDAGRNVALVGGGQTLARLAQACADLRAGKKTTHPELYAFSNWDEVVKYAREEAQGKDLLPLVNLINDHGTEKIIEATQALVSEGSADVVVSTTHKSKGRQWESVATANDFFAPQTVEGQEMTLSDGEAMIGYVATTRAQMVLDRSGLAWIDDLVDQAVEPDEVAEDIETLEEILALPAAEKEV